MDRTFEGTGGKMGIKWQAGRAIIISTHAVFVNHISPLAPSIVPPLLQYLQLSVYT